LKKAIAGSEYKQKDQQIVFSYLHTKGEDIFKTKRGKWNFFFTGMVTEKITRIGKN